MVHSRGRSPDRRPHLRSSVLVYANATNVTPANAATVAQTVDRDEALELLRAWGFDEMAGALAEKLPSSPPDSVAAYSLAEDSETPAFEVPLGWRVEGNVVSRTETSEGISWTVRTDTRTLLRMTAVIRFEAADDLLESVSVRRRAERESENDRPT